MSNRSALPGGRLPMLAGQALSEKGVGEGQRCPPRRHRGCRCGPRGRSRSAWAQAASGQPLGGRCRAGRNQNGLCLKVLPVAQEQRDSAVGFVRLRDGLPKPDIDVLGDRRSSCRAVGEEHVQAGSWPPRAGSPAAPACGRPKPPPSQQAGADHRQVPVPARASRAVASRPSARVRSSWSRPPGTRPGSERGRAPVAIRSPAPAAPPLEHHRVRCRIKGRGRDAQLEADGLLGVPVLGPELQATLRLLSKQHSLREGRPVIGPVGLAADHRDRALEATSAERLAAALRCQAAPDDQESTSGALTATP